MDTTELLKKVRKIEIKTKEISKHLFSGEYNSTFKGRGMSFVEVRNYQYGDDVRNIDWNVTARTGEPHIKVFEEERELTVLFLVDMSRSSFFGTQQQFKSEINTEICATLAFSALTNNDKVGAILFTDQVEKYIPPKKGRQHILRIIRELIDFEPTSTNTSIENALVYFNRVMKKKTICFLLSDFIDDGFENALRFTSRRHDLIGIKVYDNLEESLPNIGLIKIQDSESGRSHLLDTSSARIRDEYAQRFRAHYEYYQQAFQKAGASALLINTNDDYVKHLLKFFKSRHS